MIFTLEMDCKFFFFTIEMHRKTGKQKVLSIMKN